MSRIRLGTACAALAVTGLVPAVATAQPTTSAHAHAYEHAYHKVAHTLGHDVPGRNIVADGTRHGGRPSDAQTMGSLAVLHRMLAPAPTVSSEISGDSAGAAGVPACASESGSDYSTGSENTNASSGATGRYQILPSTAAAYGCDLGTAAGQDACAQEIYDHQGAGAWVGCGG